MQNVIRSQAFENGRGPTHEGREKGRKAWSLEMKKGGAQPMERKE